MQLDFYIDIFFIINLFMNSILLLFVQSVTRLESIRKQKMRIMLGAIAGAVMACFSAIISFGIPLISFVIEYGVTSIGMILIAFGKRNRRIFIHVYLIFILSSFLLGGMVQSISENYRKGSFFQHMFTWLHGGRTQAIFLLIVSLVLTPVIYYIFCILRTDRQYTENIYDVVLCLSNDREITCKGLMDTGNSLQDPVTSRPVIVADSDLVKDELERVIKEEPVSFCAIPYSSVGKANGLLYGFRIPRIVISNTKEKIFTDDVVVALSDSGFANPSEYRMLLHSDLLGFETK